MEYFAERLKRFKNLNDVLINKCIFNPLNKNRRKILLFKHTRK